MYFIYGFCLVVLSLSWSLYSKELPHNEHPIQEDKAPLLSPPSTTQHYSPEQCRSLRAQQLFYSELANFPSLKQDYLKKKSKELEQKLHYCPSHSPSKE